MRIREAEELVKKIVYGFVNILLEIHVAGTLSGPRMHRRRS
jgi:hypothetical protein